jgi:hypothetical protein
MTEAIIGLVGVLVGGLVSGGATYLMAQRAERAKLRAAARLVENELQHVQSLVHFDLMNLDVLRGMEADSEWIEGLPPPNLLAVSTDVWLKHQGILAEALAAEKWYSLQRAYVAIESRQQDQARYRELPQAKVVWSSEPKPTWEKEFRLVLTWIEEGMAALADLAGAERAPWRLEANDKTPGD